MEKDNIKLSSFIREMITRLEDKCTYEDLQEIKSVCSKVWRKYHPLEDMKVA